MSYYSNGGDMNLTAEEYHYDFSQAILQAVHTFSTLVIVKFQITQP